MTVYFRDFVQIMSINAYGNAACDIIDRHDTDSIETADWIYMDKGAGALLYGYTSNRNLDTIRLKKRY